MRPFVIVTAAYVGMCLALVLVGYVTRRWPRIEAWLRRTYRLVFWSKARREKALMAEWDRILREQCMKSLIEDVYRPNPLIARLEATRARRP